MRHLKAGRKLSRSDTHRRAMLRNMVTSLFDIGRIRTTDAKAKEARPVAERMITFAKRGDLHARRQVLRYVTREEIVDKLFETIGPSFKDRNGGYTRIVKIGRRRGDAAPLSVLELVNTPEPERKEDEDDKDKKKSKKAKAAKDEGDAPDRDAAKKKRKLKRSVLGAGTKA